MSDTIGMFVALGATVAATVLAIRYGQLRVAVHAARAAAEATGRPTRRGSRR